MPHPIRPRNRRAARGTARLSDIGRPQRRTGPLTRRGYDGALGLVRPAAVRIHLTVPASAPERVDALVCEQDTCGVLVHHGEPPPRRESYRRLVAAMLAQQPVRPGSVLVRGDDRLRLYAIVHDLERDPSWSEDWVRDALLGIWRVAGERGVRSLLLPPLGAVHGRLPLSVFATLLRETFAAIPVPSLRDLWLVIEAPRLRELHRAVLGAPLRDLSAGRNI